MDRTALDRHRCMDPRCGRAFAVVYAHSSAAAPIWLALACPHCGTQHSLMIATTALHRDEAAYVLPLDGGLPSIAA